MSVWMDCCIALTAGGAGPAVLVAARGDAITRLVGLQQLGSLAVLILLLLAQAVNRSSYLTVPLALALLSFGGALVFARLTVPRR